MAIRPASTPAKPWLGGSLSAGWAGNVIDARFRSIDTWPYPATHPSNRKSRYSFKASWDTTLGYLEYELEHLDASDVVIECFLRPSEIRVDGWPRSNANVPTSPGVAVHFEAGKLGHIRYATDVYEFWQHNVRAIALGLKALRAVDRYGITGGREQYRGFGELPSGIAMPAAKMTLEEAAQFIVDHSGGGHGPNFDIDDILGPVVSL